MFKFAKLGLQTIAIILLDWKLTLLLEIRFKLFEHPFCQETAYGTGTCSFANLCLIICF